MLVNHYLQKLYETYRDFASVLIKKMVPIRLIPSVVFGLYSLFGIKHRLEGNVLVGPKRIGKMDLTSIGFPGYGEIEEFDQRYIGELLDRVSLRVSELVSDESVVYTTMYYAYKLANRFDSVEELVEHIELSLAATPHAPKIFVEDPYGSLEVIIEYNIPIATSASINGSLLAFSIAAVYEKNGFKVSNRDLRKVDEYTLEAHFDVKI